MSIPTGPSPYDTDPDTAHPTPPAKQTVVIVDDHDIVRFGLEAVLSAAGEFDVVATAGSLQEALELIARHEPALVITDMSMDDSKGLDTVRAVVEAQAPRCSLVVSMHDEMLFGEQVLALGAHGFLMKERAHAEVVNAARMVLRGGRWASQELNARILGRVLSKGATFGTTSAVDAEALTVRELQVLQVLRDGKSTKQIAFELGLSPRTVDIHRANIKRKLGLRTGAELLAYALSRT